jgi:hypothetical protein
MFVHRVWHSKNKHTFVAWSAGDPLDDLVLAIHLNHLAWVKSERVVDSIKENISVQSMRLWTKWTPVSILENCLDVYSNCGIGLFHLFEDMIDQVTESCCKYNHIYGLMCSNLLIVYEPGDHVRFAKENAIALEQWKECHVIDKDCSSVFIHVGYANTCC